MAKKASFHSPFAEVGKELKKRLEADQEAKKPAPPTKPKPRHEEEDLRTFAEIMGGKPIAKDPRGKPQPAPAAPVATTPEDADAWVDFASLVEGDGSFDFDDTEIEGAVPGLDRRILRSLRRGDYPIGATLDLHGLQKEPAREAVERFVSDARARGVRAVRIIHGKGLNSEDGMPVLKAAMKSWLGRGKVGRHILAFSSARPQDGGSGAVILLLRR